MNAAISEKIRLHQKRPVLRPALIAPGISKMKALSTASIEIIEVVSVTTAALIASLPLMSLPYSERIVSKYPKKKAKTIEIIILAKLDQPTAVLITIPTISPIEQPSKQWSV